MFPKWRRLSALPASRPGRCSAKSASAKIDPRTRPRCAGSALVVRALDGLAFELDERHERHRPAVVDVGAPHPDLAFAFLLHHLEDMLGARRSDRNHHDAASPELL